MKISILLAFILISTATWSQKAIPITAAEKKALVDSIKKRLERYYVFPDKGKEMGQYIAKRLNAKAYDGIWDYNAFLDTLATDLAGVHHDPHLRLGFDPGYVQHLKERKSQPLLTAERLEADKAFYRRNNYGFTRVEILPGNIGYIVLTEFAKANDESRTIVASAFEFIAYTDAVIIDLRSNTGGQPELMQEVLSYFFDKPVHTSSTYDRELGTTVENYSLARVKGRKIPTKKLYILTSGSTFSAGEALPYFLKNLKRAVIVGEVTAGAAHGMKGFIVNDQVVMEIPYMRGIDPITKTDWEGVGVQPDVAVKADKALAKAQEIFMKSALATVRDSSKKFSLEWGLVSVKAQLDPLTLTDTLKNEYAGVYGIRTIFIEDGYLMFQRGDGPKRKLFALTEDTFELEGVDHYRLRFVRNSDGKVDKMIGSNNYNVTNEFLRLRKPNGEK
jgi:retinol-binding protein 3